MNSFFDGSYNGNQYDLPQPYGYSLSRLGPSVRVPITYIYVCKKSNFEYSNDINDLTCANQMQFNTLYNTTNGLERLYYHTRTLSPIKAKEILKNNEDSDNEIDPEWLKEQTEMYLLEFTDVNTGEKGLMKLWNYHSMSLDNLVGDCQIQSACESFIQKYTHLILKLNLKKNFLLHLANLYDYGLLKQSVMLQLIDLFYLKINEIQKAK